MPTLQAVIPTTQPVTNTPSGKASHKWAATQLNIIMLPVGIGLLVIVSCIAFVCSYLRKQRIKQLQKELLRQRRKASKKFPHSFANSHCSFNSKQLSVNQSPINASEKTFPQNVNNAGKEEWKQKRKKKMDSGNNYKCLNGSNGYKKENSQDLDETRKYVVDTSSHPHPNKKRRTSVEPIKESTEPVKEPTGSQLSTSIPAPLHQVQNKRTSRFSSTHNGSIARSSSPNKNNTKENIVSVKESWNDSIEKNENKLSRDRRKWDIPNVDNLGYDKKGSLRLPPLAELRIAKTA